MAGAVPYKFGGFMFNFDFHQGSRVELSEKQYIIFDGKKLITDIVSNQSVFVHILP